MITNVPRAAAVPPAIALPYPRSGTSTTRAPDSTAIACEPSVLPLSATMTSPSIPSSSIVFTAFLTTTDRASASLRQGITTESSSSVIIGVGRSISARVRETGHGCRPEERDDGDRDQDVIPRKRDVLQRDLVPTRRELPPNEAGREHLRRDLDSVHRHPPSRIEGDLQDQ